MSFKKSDLATKGADAKKRRRLFVFLDILLLVAIVAAVFFLILLLTPLNPFSGNKSEACEITYTIELADVDKEVYTLLQKGDTVTDAETGKVIGEIVTVDQREYAEYVFDQTESAREDGRYVMVKEPVANRYTVTLTVRATAEYTEGEGFEVERCRIAVGRAYALHFPRYAGEGECITLKRVEGEVS